MHGELGIPAWAFLAGKNPLKGVKGESPQSPVSVCDRLGVFHIVNFKLFLRLFLNAGGATEFRILKSRNNHDMSTFP